MDEEQTLKGVPMSDKLLTGLLALSLLLPVALLTACDPDALWSDDLHIATWGWSHMHGDKCYVEESIPGTDHGHGSQDVEVVCTPELVHYCLHVWGSLQRGECRVSTAEEAPVQYHNRLPVPLHEHGRKINPEEGS